MPERTTSQEVKSVHIFNTDTYEYHHDTGTYEVTPHYNSENNFIDIIKAAIKRDFELANHEKAAETLDF